MSESSKQYSTHNTQDPKHIRGGEKKVMKKSLSAILAASMAFSMFASAAFAADPALDTEGKFQAMKTAGIFQGYPDGKSHLEATMTRAEFAKALAALLGLEDDAAAAKVYSDVAANHWAIGEIGALTAEEIMNGTGAGKFGPKVNVSIEQLAKIVVGAMGLEPKEDAEVEGKTSVWATGYVAAAIEAGLITKSADYTTLATRGNLVDASYTVFEKGQEAQITVKSAVALNEKSVEFTFSDGKTATKTLDTALEEGKATKVSIEYNGKTYEAEVTLQALTAEAKITGRKTIEVAFNRTVDAEKAKVTVAKNNNDVEVEGIKYAENKLSATVTLKNHLTVGDYVVTVDPDGSSTTANSLKSTVKAENEKVTKIEFSSDKLGIVNDSYTKASVSYKVTNQFGEDITKNVTDIAWTTSKGTVSAANGKLTINAPVTSGSVEVPFVTNEVIVVTGVHSASTTVVSGTLTVGTRSMVDAIEVKGVYNAEKKELNTGSNYDEFYILVDAKDQYGNSVTASQFATDVVAVPSNAAIFTLGTPVDGVGETGNNIGVPLVKNSAVTLDGTNTVSFISKFNTKTVKTEVEVKKAAALSTFTLNTPAVAVATNDVVRIPFSAVDQFGNAITKHSELVDKVDFNPTNSVKLKKDYATGNAYVEYTAPAQSGNYVIIAVVKGTVQTSQLTIDVKSSANPTSISISKDLATNFLVGGVLSVDEELFKVKDQYGRDYAQGTDFYNNYYLKLTPVSNAGKLTIPANYVSDDQDQNFTAVSEGVERVRVEIMRRSAANAAPAASDSSVAGSAAEFNLNVVAKSQLSEVVLDDIPTLYNGNGASGLYNKTISAHGKKSDGTKVIIPASLYNVIGIGDLSVDNTTKVINPSTVVITDANSTVERNISIVVDADVPAIPNKVVKVSNIAPKVTSIDAASTTKPNPNTDPGQPATVAKITVDGTVLKGAVADIDDASLFAALTFKDQYGVAITGTPADTYLTVTGHDASKVTIAANGKAVGTADIAVTGPTSFTLTIQTKTDAKKTYTVVAE